MQAFCEDEFSFLEDMLEDPIKDWKEYSLNEILSFSDPEKQAELLSLYHDFIATLPKNYITKSILALHLSVCEIEKLCEENRNARGEFVSFYSGIKEVRAKETRICQISGGRIEAGSFYYTYRPFMENLNTGRKFILKNTIHAEIAYYDFFPQTIGDFERLSFYLKHPSFAPQDGIDYYFLGQQIGENLPLLEVESNKGKQRIRKQLRKMQKR